MAPTLPPIEDPQLLARLRMGEAEFREHVLEIYDALPSRGCDAGALQRALGYPWSRPRGSFLLSGEETTPLDEASAGERASLEARFATGEGRHPLLAIGSNGSPATLRAKFAHLTGRADHEVLVLSGSLEGFDIGAAAHLAPYASLPATLFPSPGTSVASALLWLTPAQFTSLAWSEVNYRIGRLRARFEPDGGNALEGVFVFVSRFGTFAPDGEPLALAAVPASGRDAAELTQERLLDRAAAILFGNGADAASLVRAMLEDRAETMELVAERLWPLGIPFASDRWNSFPPTE